MPNQDFTQEEIQEMLAKGIDPNTATIVQSPQQNAPGYLSTIGKTLKARAGGIAGGGAGAIGGMKLGAGAGLLLAGGPEDPLAAITVPAGAILGGAIGALGGGYVGQKGQQAIESPETYAAQQEAYQQAAATNPKTALATDIAASALASGGSFNPETTIRGVGGILGRLVGRPLTREAQQVLFQSAINPAISTGLSLAQGQGIPSFKELGAQAAGGALFADTWLPKGRAGLLKLPRVPDEPQTETGNQTPIKYFPEEQPTPFTATDENGNYKLGNKSIKNLYIKQFAKTIPKDANDLFKAQLRTENDNLLKVPIDEMRATLHNQAIQDRMNSLGSMEESLISAEEASKLGMLQEPKPEVGDEIKRPIINEQGQPVFTSEILQHIIDKGATKPISVQRIFPKLKLSIEEATEALRQADLLAELHLNRPTEEQENATRIRENEGQLSEARPPIEGSEANRGPNMVEKTPGSKESVSQVESEAELQKQLNEELKKKGMVNAPPRGTLPYILNPNLVTQDILSNEATTGSILHGLANSPNHPLQELAQHILAIADKKSLEVFWLHNPTLDHEGGERSHYDTQTDQVYIGTGAAGDSRVVLEEVIHSLTSKKTPAFVGQGAEYFNKLNSYLKTSNNEAVKDLIRAYLHAAKVSGLHDALFKDTQDVHGNLLRGAAGVPDIASKRLVGYGQSVRYGMGHVDEFIAQAIKDPEFQKFLDSIKDPENTNRTLWQKFVDCVRRILGLNAKDGSMLDRVLRSSAELIHQERVTAGAKSGKVNTTPRLNSGDYLINAVHMVENSKGLLGIEPNHSGVFNGSQLLATIFNKLTPTEQQIYKDAGIIKAFSNRKITKEDAINWLKENTPEARVHSYGMEGKVSEAKKEYDKMTHEWLETLPQEARNTISTYVDADHIPHVKSSREIIRENYPQQLEKADRLRQLKAQIAKEPLDTSPRATSYYNTVSALPTNEPMPEWTTSKEWKNVQRVDVVIPVKKHPRYTELVNNPPGGYLNEAQHNEVAALEPVKWQPDNFHENLPNTLGWAMIQYKTGPKGEKIALINEAQSRWGQHMREYSKPGNSTTNSGHPLLHDYNRLILKAAINQARKEGATHIVVPDSETAMMTEGHDVNARLENERGLDRIQQYRDHYEIDGIPYRTLADAQKALAKEIPKIAQEPGMRLNYDTILPKIAEELTGSKGEKVSLGEHKNAMEGPQTGWSVETPAHTPRKNLIFRNPDGTPKTDVSGMMYSLENVPEREPKLFGKRYAAPPEEAPKTPQISPDGKIEPKTPRFLGSVGKFFTDAILRSRQVAPEVADAYHRFFNARQQYFGDVYGRVKNVMDKTGFTRQDGARLLAAMRQEELTKAPIPMSFFKNTAQRAVWLKYKEVYREQAEEAIKDKEPVFDYHTRQYRLRRISDISHPLMLNTKIADILRDTTNTGAINQLHEEFIKDQLNRGIEPEKAEENYSFVVDALRGKSSTAGLSTLNRFNANRRSQGVPLPDTWTKQDFEDNLYSYAARNAADRAHFKYIESDPNIMAQLGETRDAWGNKIEATDKPIVTNNKFIRALVDEARGEIGPQGFYTERAGSGSATALFISSPALSAIHVPISNIAAITSLAANPVELSRVLWAGLKGMTSGIATAQANGLMIPRARSAARMFDASLTAAEKLQTFASVIRRISSLNDLVTKANIGYMQAAMEVIVPSKLIRAAEGDINAQQFLRKLDPDYKIGKQYTDKEIEQLATQAIGYLHGTNDPRTMPEWMMRDNEISGFFSIAHWTVAQTDRFMRDVWEPARQGNLTPLIMNIFGAAVGGYIIKDLREKISGKHSPIPSLTEIINSDRGVAGNAGPLAYNAMAAMQYAGFAGLFSQLAKYPFDLAYKNGTQALAFPLDEEVSDLVKTAGQVTSAIMNDPHINFVDLAHLVSAHIFTSDFRLSREAYQQMINAGLIHGTLAERKLLADKMSKLRRFEQVEGMPFQEMTPPENNPFMFPEQQEFKRTQDLQEAMHELPTLIGNIMQQYKANPDIMLGKLRALKDMQYNAMPNIQNYPLSFSKYLQYISRMEGPEAAQVALQDYMHHKIINEVKGSVVP